MEGEGVVEDAEVPAAAWAAYDPARATVAVDPARARGAPLPHLTSFARAGGPPPAAATAHSRDRRVRATVLSPAIIRVEVLADGAVEGGGAASGDGGGFEDRPSFCFAHRGAGVGDGGAEFELVGQRALRVRTERVEVDVDPEGGLRARLRVDGWAEAAWSGGTAGGASDGGDLGGTCRTLDEADGFARRDWATGRRRRDVRLGHGLFSRRCGVVFVDDSARPLFTDDGWFAPRADLSSGAGARVDCYVLAAGTDFLGGLRDFTRLAGAVPMVPRAYLGNWWSRYHAYSDGELRGVLRHFQERTVPLSMCIVDMDWHLVSRADGVAETSDGWTGYTWNKRLFPDPPAFVHWLHARGTASALNLHPADGVHPHEDKYDDFANFIGATAKDTRAPIPFDITDRMCASAYFCCLIHPLEEGAGELAKWSWWCDWQQGQSSRMPGVDPLFLLNHLHYRDMERRVDGRVVRRPVIFSRYAGPGSHRTPIGFSGDTHATWDSLAFQAYMTATAANAAFTYWSHDIGGHTRGQKDDALYARWVQFGCLSPILRLHSSNNPYINHMPWSYGIEACEAACAAMRLRHQLVPYIYSCNWKTHTDTEPLVMPMYYLHPRQSDAYAAPAQYWFGRQLVVAPFSSPPDITTGLSRQTVWLPQMTDGSTAAAATTAEGTRAAWRHLFSGEAMQPGWHSIYGDLEFMPVFAPAGAIIPLAAAFSHMPRDARDFNSVSNPESIDLYVIAGSDGSFSMYEDEESGTRAAFATDIRVRVDFDNKSLQLTISPPRRVAQPHEPAETDADLVVDARRVLPRKRSWRVIIVGVSEDVMAGTTMTAHDTTDVLLSTPTESSYDRERETATFVIADCDSLAEITLRVCSLSKLISSRDRSEERVERLLKSFSLGIEKKWQLLKEIDALLGDPCTTLANLEKFEEVPDFSGTLFTVTPAMILALVETIDKCGFSHNYASRPGAPAVFWSGRRDDVTVSLRRTLAPPAVSIALQKAVVVWPEASPAVPKTSSAGSANFSANTARIQFGAALSADLHLRDSNDVDGAPVPTLFSTCCVENVGEALTALKMQ